MECMRGGIDSMPAWIFLDGLWRVVSAVSVALWLAFEILRSGAPFFSQKRLKPACGLQPFCGGAYSCLLRYASILA